MQAGQIRSHPLQDRANPVAGPFYNFTIPESMGVVAAIAPETPSLLGL